MQKSFNLLVFIGRFQPFHNSHKKVLEIALQQSEQVLVLIGSSYRPRDPKNPFTYDERKTMIRDAMQHHPAIGYAPLRDHPYNDNKWLAQVQSVVNAHVTEVFDRDVETLAIGLVGHFKDQSSYYLRLFPHMQRVEVPNFEKINATDLRRYYFEDDKPMLLKSAMPEGCREFLDEFHSTEHYTQLVDEYNYLKKYKAAWSAAPYDVTFITVDIVFVSSAHVLMIRRKAIPGKGLLALPGGFIKPDEYLKDAAVRELKEETKIQLPFGKSRADNLKELISKQRVFDRPDRSLRGRTITHAYYIEYNGDELPKVKGGDDASHAMWVPISSLTMMEEQIFEDHLAVIETFVNM